MLPQIVASTANQFSAIAALVGGNFVCVGSYPAHVGVEILHQLADIDGDLHLTYNDIDIYYGEFGMGHMVRNSCSYEKIEGVPKEVNFLKCTILVLNL